jgi:hypothetical protein
MATKRIVTADKIGLVAKKVHVNQFWDDDYNEIKEVANNNADEIDLNTDNIAAVSSGQKGIIEFDSPAPTEDGYYRCGNNGTYTNFGGLVVDLATGINDIFVSVGQTQFDLGITPANTTPTGDVAEGETLAVNGDKIFDVTNALSDDIIEIRDGYDFSQHTIQNINVVTNTTVNFGNGFIEIDLKLGKTAIFRFNDPNVVIGSGTFFIYLRKTIDNQWFQPYVISKNTDFEFTATQDFNGVSVGIGASSVIADGVIELKYDYDEVIESLIKQQSREVSETFPIIAQGDAIIDFNEKFGLIDSKRVFDNVPSIVVGGDNTKARYIRNIFNLVAYFPLVTTTNDAYLTELNLTEIDANNISAVSTENMPFNKFIRIEDGNLLQQLADGNGKRFRLEVFVYSKNLDFPVIGNTSIVGSSGNHILSNLLSVEDTTSVNVKKLIFSSINNLTEVDGGTYLNININCTATSTYNVGDYGFTGWKIGLFDNTEDETTKELIGDWELEKMDIPLTVPYAKGQEYADYLNGVFSNGFEGYDFNHVEDTKRNLALYFNRLENEYVDEFNRILVSFNGDSIIGSQLDDIEHSAGYLTGDFPPNMSKLIIARQFFDRYKLVGEDTEFRNLIHSDWTKTGFAISNGKDDLNQTFNQIEVYGGASGDEAEITVSGYKYLKLVWSEYKGVNYSFDILRSTDGGSNFTPIETISVTSARQLMVAYKIYEITPATSYIYKIVPTSGYADVCFWGVEMWNNNRLDVVVEAFSGTTAAGTVLDKLDGYYSEQHKPALIIMDILAINDFAVSENVNNWISDITELYTFIKGKSIPFVAFGTHYPVSDFVQIGCDVTSLQNIPVINILDKQANPTTVNTEPIVNQVDGLHLSDNGNAYYFEELKKIFD